MPSDSSMFSMSSDAVLWEGAQCSKDRDHQEPYYYCMRCDRMVCRDCWLKIEKHTSQEPGHDPTKPNDAIIVHSILKVKLDEQPMLEDAIKRCRVPHLRQNYDNNEWFGVRRKNEAGGYSLVEGHAYNLIADSFRTSKSDIYPGLVSFVGGTGSGKSTLIELLAKFADPLVRKYFKTPAVGDSGSCQSTSSNRSSNVHLYADPRTFQTRSPILYAECEGIDGDETPAEMGKSLTDASASSDPLSHASQILELGSHDIIWSKMPRNSGACTRKEIIKTLFPRILYIFSDVVVFSFSRIQPDDTLLQLAKWGHSAMIQSYNKPLLPSCIIAFSNRDDQVGRRENNLNTARKSFFEGLQDFSKDKTLQPYIQYWKTYGRRIASAEDFLSCYYSSVSVVHLPSAQRPTTMHRQIEKLYGRIKEMCSESQERRAAAWMKWDAPTLSLFVRKAFTHFASKYETPFNFSDASVDLQNSTPNFTWSIFNLARMVRGRRDLSQAGMDLWVRINEFVASCVFLNCVRTKQDGKNPVVCRFEIETSVRS
ncbi:hypothetical protein CEP54_007630 [Fusarium duplospermum]|uniref:Uncharacterized protein n=1 Tax=Fusarium duplospermum TaxID=1325734 RepID=A0A428Q030_9HYPO|nr:hypothetical protein CEP54_007630 [Fusarium duplospermum]